MEQRSCVIPAFVAALLIACTASFGMCMSVEAMRAEIADTVMKWYDAFVPVFYVSEDTPPSVIEEHREPTLQLAGAEKRVVLKAETIYQILYMKSFDVGISYPQMVISDESVNIDSKNRCIQEKAKVSGYEARLLVYGNGRNVITGIGVFI